MNISIFFDGTGNNKDVDEPLKRWSNPARLWRAAQFLLDEDAPNYSIYVAGVGTPFNGSATDWMDRKLIEVEDGMPGLVAGNGGTRRTDFGQSNVNDQLRAALMQSAAKLDISLKPYLEKGKPANIRGLAAAIEAHGLITIVNLSIFGFSRGAALARAFSNEMLAECDVGQDGVTKYHGVPIRFHFMGLFDTVASFGVPSKNMDTPFNEKNLVVSHAVERCVHYIAAHELRFSFPVDLIRKEGRLAPGWIETVYPGVHSDVGGGYEPLCQGIANDYARIPMRDMMREAVKSGVRLVDYDDVPKFDKGIFKSRFEVKPDVELAYKQYMSAVGAGSSVEQAMINHMRALYAAWGTMTRRKLPTPDLLQSNGEKSNWKAVGHQGIAWEADLLLDPVKAKQYVLDHPAYKVSKQTLQIQGMKYRINVRPEPWRLEAWQALSPDPVLNFVRMCVHDSKAGFVMGAEPFSYFRPRGMAESSRNILAHGLSWLDDAASAVIRGVIKVCHKAEGVVVETWEEGKLVAIHTYPVGEK
ncbi:MAG: T6SS phospholipase effector Tle1-like catalytic domain-containing protein, partial [Gammaproteobacteria bacterium]